MKTKTTALFLSVLLMFSLTAPVLAQDAEVIEEPVGQQTESIVTQEMDAVPAYDKDAQTIEIEALTVAADEDIVFGLPEEGLKDQMSAGAEGSTVGTPQPGAESETQPGTESAAQPGTGDGTTAQPGTGDGTAAQPGTGDGTAAQPGTGDGTAAQPGTGDGTTAQPGTGDGTAAQPGTGDGTAAQPGTGDGTAAQPGTEGTGTPAVPSAGNSIAEATEIQIGAAYSGALSVTNIADYYRFSIGSSGRVGLSASSNMEKLYCYLYDASGSKIWQQQKSLNKVTGQLMADETLDLTQGTYYIAFATVDEKEKTVKGDYSFNLSFTGAVESFAESGNGTNNTKETANDISIGANYYGQIALNDKQDYYRFRLDSSGKVRVTSAAKVRGLSYRIYYDTENSTRWKVSPGWDSTLGQANLSEDADLIAGTYYLVIYESKDYTGSYSFSLSFTSANESFPEYQLWANNTMETANDIWLDTTYAGQIAANDGKDFYRFTVNTGGTMTLQASAEAQGITYIIYDRFGYEIWSTKQKRSANAERIDTLESLEMDPGTYYFVAARHVDYTGNYTFSLSVHTHNFVREVTKATMTTNGSVVVRCSCGETLSSQTIFHPAVIALSSQTYTYNGKARKPYVTVTGSDGRIIDPANYTVTYASGRRKVGKYAVKVKFKGDYSGSKTLKFAINPKKTSISSLKAVSKGFTVNVKKLTAQTTGYQIQYSTNKQFTGTLKSTYLRNTKTTVTVKKLTAKKKYYVRVRTYKQIDGGKIYSAWSGVKGITTKE